ncbi:putative peptidoglycan lipid II flippase [Kribbella sp. VKM Ac-2527]|uniref:Putative peptidoglycan lipid II flippase n=1 Tax=Kribbella caucasensis TaxID=2512215 RepID=A0A4R6JHN3_9ACTN|nr:lipid II flippase MurJ [Kribbella sp. VKM Ac-2527]TDO35600.1 putative peptidoglycan lipid II flippase [Kribbella sp. VKM Ac-2527]
MSTGGRVARAALLVAGVTVLARVVGFGRWLVFSKTVGAGCLAEAYATANQLPNVLFEIVVGGALAGAVIPVLAGPVARGDRAAQGRIIGALLTWSVVLLAPFALLAWLLASQYTSAMLDAGPECGGSAETATRMLVIFVPQVFGYAVAVIATAVLQSHHRFAAGALAPLVSSVVVIGTYLIFAAQAPRADEASRSAADLLAWGTTAGVAALALTVLLPMLALRIPVRPTFRLDPGVGPVLRRLALAGLAVLVAQQLAFLAATYLANHRGIPGSIAVYTWANAVYVLPYAVLAVPITTAVFPRLAAAFEARDTAGFELFASTSTRAVMLAGGAGAALLVGTAVPVARVFAYDDGRVQEAQASSLVDGLFAFAPALIGFAVLMHVGRVLYARQAGRSVAVVTGTAWLVVAAVGFLLSLRWDGGGVVFALAAAMSVGMLAGAVVLLVVLRRAAGPAVLSGLPRATVAALVGAVLAAAVGWFISLPSGDGSWGSGLVFSVLSGLAVVIVYAGVVVALDRQDARALLRRGVPTSAVTGEEKR